MLEIALAYARDGWPVFPCCWRGPKRKAPLIRGGFNAATTEVALISAWWRRWPDALIGTPSGRGFVVLDVDMKNGHDGLATLAALGFPQLPATPTAKTASGGFHLYFEVCEIRNTQGARGAGIGDGLDWRGIGGYVIVPARGSGYEWLGETAALPFAPVPESLLPRLPEAPAELVVGGAVCTELSDYGEAALRSAAERILTAPPGEQEATLNGEAFAIGRLAGAGGVPADLALYVLLTSGRAMPSHDRGRPWRLGEVEAKVRRAFAEGIAKPRPRREDVEAEFDRLMAGPCDVG